MYDFIKRFMDIFLSTFALILLIPIFIPIFLILKFSGEGEVFYIQKRLGQNQKEFGMLQEASQQCLKKMPSNPFSSL